MILKGEKSAKRFLWGPYKPKDRADIIPRAKVPEENFQDVWKPTSVEWNANVLRKST